jgi:hypothetical protein
MHSWHKFITTKKEHQCLGCHGIIPKGRKVDHCKYVDNGEWDSYYLCEICQSIINEDKNSGEIEFGEGELFHNGPNEWFLAAKDFEKTTNINFLEVIKVTYINKWIEKHQNHKLIPSDDPRPAKGFNFMTGQYGFYCDTCKKDILLPSFVFKKYEKLIEIRKNINSSGFCSANPSKEFKNIVNEEFE